jgi:hypothetical protein
MNLHDAQVALQAGHRCEYCHAPEAVFNFPLEVEHIIPLLPNYLGNVHELPELTPYANDL